MKPKPRYQTTKIMVDHYTRVLFGDKKQRKETIKRAIREYKDCPCEICLVRSMCDSFHECEIFDNWHYTAKRRDNDN